MMSVLNACVTAGLLLTAVCTSPTTLFGQGAEPSRARRLEIGHLKARALLQCATGATRDAPLAIIVPGTGAHGPEEAMPPSITADGKDTQILTSFAEGFRAAGFHTLQLGKPGVEFHTGWDEKSIAYDKDLYLRLTWNDLLESTDEAIAYVEAEHPCGASTVILAAHSEGSGRILDVAMRNPKVRGLVFLGYHGHSLKEMVDFQAYRRPVDMVAKTDVDADHDGYITRDEAARWPKEFTYAWKDGETKVSIADYAKSLRDDPRLTTAIAGIAALPIYSNGIWDRPPMYAQVAALKIPVVAFSGTLDVMTPPDEIENLRAACARAHKTDCEAYLVPGLGHGFSPPKPPRSHPVLDQTEGPVSPAFLEMFARTLKTWRAKIRPG
jgi:pimeloyl-ACP methyl ester carboxylesterase